MISPCWLESATALGLALAVALQLLLLNRHDNLSSKAAGSNKPRRGLRGSEAADALCSFLISTLHLVLLVLACFWMPQRLPFLIVSNATLTGVWAVAGGAAAAAGSRSRGEPALDLSLIHI